MKNLDAQGFNLDMMGDVKDYLGINFERLADVPVAADRANPKGPTQRVPPAASPSCKEICTGPRARESSTIDR
jgi:hypothetical protein